MVTLASLFGVPGPKVFYYSLSGLHTFDENAEDAAAHVENPLTAGTLQGPRIFLEDSGIDGLPIIRVEDPDAVEETPLVTFTIPAALYDTSVLLGQLLDLLAE